MMTSVIAGAHRDFVSDRHRGPSIDARPESELRFLKSGPVHTVAGLCGGMDVEFVIPRPSRFEASFSESRLRLEGDWVPLLARHLLASLAWSVVRWRLRRPGDTSAELRDKVQVGNKIPGNL